MAKEKQKKHAQEKEAVKADEKVREMAKFSLPSFKMPKINIKLSGIQTKNTITKYWWLWALILIAVFALWLRCMPIRYGELLGLDEFYIYRMAEYVLNHNFQLPEVDHLRYWPDGFRTSSAESIIAYYVPIAVYLIFLFLWFPMIIFGLFGMQMTFFNFALFYPAMMGTLDVIIIFFVAKELFNDRKAGILASVFLATSMGYMSRVVGGLFEKEATGGTFLLFAIYCFLRSYNKNSWKWGIASGISIAIGITTWGGSQFVIFLIAIFLIFNLLINKYHERMIKAAFPTFVFYLIGVNYSVYKSFFSTLFLTLEGNLAIFLMAFLLIRFLDERYSFIKKENLQYLFPGALVLLFVVFLIGSMFSDMLYGILLKLVHLIALPEQTHISGTVAEQMPGSWAEITSRFSIVPALSVFPVLQPVVAIFSVWFLMLLGMFVFVYKMYSTRNWLLVFPAFWVVMGIQTTFHMIRLMYFLGPASALAAGYFLSSVINKISKLEYMKKREGMKKINIVSLLVVAVLTIIIMTNLLSAYIYCSSMGTSFNQYWKEAMNFLSEKTPVNSSVLSWWDFGYWFQTRGHRPSIADGGNNNGTVNVQIAQWFMDDSTNWTRHRSWLIGKDVKYILMDYTLPGKYGAITKVGTFDRQIVGMLQFQQTGSYPQQNKTIIEFKAGQYTVWLPLNNDGTINSPSIFMISKDDQYYGRSYITDLCTTNGILRFSAPENSNILPGCVALSGFGVFYIPPEAENTIFTNLMFMDGYGIPDLKKVFDNQLIKIYKVEINETASAP